MEETQAGGSWVGRTVCALAGTAFVAAGAYFFYACATLEGHAVGKTTFLLAGICFLLLGAFALFLAFSRRGEEEFRREDPLQQRAEHLGLPTEPEAYRDGGVALAATASTVQEAELIAAVLRGEGIPAWVDGAAVATWYWYFRFGLSPGGIRVIVPLGRLSDAHAVVAAHQQDRLHTHPASAPEEPEEPGAEWYYSARRLAYLLILVILAPVVLVLSLRLLWRVRRHWPKEGAPPGMVKGRRLGRITAIVSALILFPWVVILCQSCIHSRPRHNEDSVIHYYQLP